jgi:hypothetical protein
MAHNQNMKYGFLPPSKKKRGQTPFSGQFKNITGSVGKTGGENRGKTGGKPGTATVFEKWGHHLTPPKSGEQLNSKIHHNPRLKKLFLCDLCDLCG